MIDWTERLERICLAGIAIVLFGAFMAFWGVARAVDPTLQIQFLERWLCEYFNRCVWPYLI